MYLRNLLLILALFTVLCTSAQGNSDPLAADSVIMTGVAVDSIYSAPPTASNAVSILPSSDLGAGFSLISLLRGLLGLLVLIGIAWLFSTNRKAISWKVVGIGLGLQITLAVGVLKVPFVRTLFEFVGKIFVVILDFTKAGSEFLMGGLMNVESYGFIFAFQILPTIIFFFCAYQLTFLSGNYSKDCMVHCLCPH